MLTAQEESTTTERPTPTAPHRTMSKFVPSFIAETIALKHSIGQPVHSQYSGDQVKFWLVDGRSWYTDIVTAQRIEQLRIQPGETFEVVKTEIRRGNQRIVEISVNYPKTPADSQQRGTESAGEANRKGSSVTGSTCNPNSNPTTRRAAAPISSDTRRECSSPQLPQLPQNSVPAKADLTASTAANVPMNGNGETYAVQLARCYRDAVDIAVLAVAYAKEMGIAISPGFADIRALAATIAIAEGGRRV